jgi:serine/threonine-protein kinase PknG
MEFRGYQTTYVAALPPVAETPVFQQYDSFYRLVAKACAPQPLDRFATVAELRVQLLGVLREVVAANRPGVEAARYAAPSLHFETPDVADPVLDWTRLPRFLTDPADPQAGWLAGVSVEDPEARLAMLGHAPERSPEVLLQTGRAALLARRFDVVVQVAEELLRADPWDWRAVWLQGLRSLALGDGVGAQAAFNAVYGQVPGELAPKLALALACETSNEPDVAESLYLTCARTDASYAAPAAFALARIRIARGDTPGAVAALDLVSPTSRAFPEARRRRAHLLAGVDGGLDTLAAAMASIDGVAIDPHDRARLTADVLDRALEHVRRHGAQPTVLIGRHRAHEGALRDGLESTYRALAGMVRSREERVALVDRANRVRRWTFR